MTQQDNEHAAFEAQIELPPLPITPTMAQLLDKAAGKGCSSVLTELLHEYARAAIEHDRKRQGDSAKVLAELVALIPLADTLNASASCQDLIDYFKGVIADRQRRGEPVGWLVTGPYEKVAFACEQTAKSYMVGLNRGFGEEAYKISPLYISPQPAEPVKMPSDD